MSEQRARTGRPPEDRFLRQLEIFEAVLPLLQSRGARALTMRDAAAASFMSVGGLNHYFPTKAQLLFWPLAPEVCAAAHEDYRQRHALLRERDPEAFFHGFVEETAGAIVEYCAPAVQAAIEMGARDFWDAIDGALTPAPMIALFEEIRGALAADERDRLTRGIRRAFIGAAFDQRVSREELFRDVWGRLNDAAPPTDVLVAGGVRG